MNALTPFEQAAGHSLGIEGGFANHPDDPGGATQYGVTEAVARAHGWTGRMRDLPRKVALSIYRSDYWDRIGLDHVAAASVAIAIECFDTGVNCGVTIPVRFLQRVLNVLNLKGTLYADIKVDGAAGPATFKALAAFLQRRGKEGEAVLLDLLNALQGVRYVELAEANPDLESFLYGWARTRL